MKFSKTFFVPILIIFGLLLSACGGEATPEPTPTLSLEAMQTLAVATFSAQLTQTALAAPTSTPAPTNTPAATLPVSTLANVTPFGTGVGAAPTASCYRLSYVADVNIPDDTSMTAGQTFTKTWKVRNSGTCAWDAGFKFAFTGGDAMGGSTYTLPQSVAANAEIDISVSMTAPTNKTGAIRGNWRISTAAGQFFGDEVYVQIQVGAAAAATNTGAAPATATSTPTATATP